MKVTNGAFDMLRQQPCLASSAFPKQRYHLLTVPLHHHKRNFHPSFQRFWLTFNDDVCNNGKISLKTSLLINKLSSLDLWGAILV